MRIAHFVTVAAGIAVAACGGSPPVIPSTPPTPIRAVSLDELRNDLTVFASDSFGGRESGTPYVRKAAAFLSTRLTALGLEPAGDSMFYQRVPLYRTVFGAGTRFSVSTGQSSVPLALGTDLVPIVNLGAGAPLPRRNAEGDVFFAGYGMDTLGRRDFRGIDAPGRVIVMVHGAPASVTDSAAKAKLEGNDELSLRIVRALAYQPTAIILMLAGERVEFYQQALPTLLRAVSRTPDNSTSDGQRPLPMVILAVAKPGSPLLPAGWPSAAADEPQALTGRRFTAHIEARSEPYTDYNIVAIVRGTDPRLNKTYVAFGSHYDHAGFQPGGAPDSIANGADDDASGSITMLALAKAMMTARPRRSTIFIWHTAEEKGLLGSEHFAAAPTVPMDSIVAMINIDMIGRRGGSHAKFNSQVDRTSGENRLFVLGPLAAPNNQSRTLGAIFDSVNARQVRPFVIDRALDSPTHPEKYYERSDHINYARKGVPIIFFSTGFHEDYHKVSDEASKIDYDKMGRIGGLLLELATTLGNREARPR